MATPDDEVWVCKDGRRFLVRELTEDHAKSILRMILKKRRKLRELKAALNAIAQMEDETFYDSDDK